MNTEFGIKDKIVQTVTDSGSNFLKAFKLFGAEHEIVEASETLLDREENEDDDEVDEPVCFIFF